MNINSLNCSVCGVPVRKRTIAGDDEYLDSDNMPCSETPRFHDHDGDWEPVAEPAFFDLLRPEPGPRVCTRCNAHIDEYAPGETLCGACDDEVTGSFPNYERKRFPDLTEAEQAVVDLGASIIEQMPGMAVTFEEDETEVSAWSGRTKVAPDFDLSQAKAAARRVAGRGFGPESMLGSDEAAERARADYEAAQAKLAEQVAVCPYCKGAKTRALNKLGEWYDQPSNVSLEQYETRAKDAMGKRCKSHAMRGRLNFACSPVSENYWCS